MPSSIFFNGQRRFRPNVYSRVINNLSAGAGIATGNVAIVGDFPQFKKATPATFASDLDFKDYLRGTNNDLAYASALLFNALTQGTIDSLTVVNAGSSTQASNTNDGVKVSSILYGIDGNRISYKITANSTAYDISVYLNGVEKEKVEALGDGAIATLRYTPAQANESFTKALLEIDSSELSVLGRLSLAEAIAQTGGDVLAGESVANGAVTITLQANQSADTIVTIAGLDATGSALSEDVTILSTGVDGDTYITTGSFSRVDSITLPASNSFAGVFECDVPIYVASLDNISNLEDSLNEIVALNNEISGAFSIDAPASILKGEDLDTLSATEIQATSASIKADVSTIVDWFNGSSYVQAIKSSGTAPTTLGTALRLTGGSNDATISSSEWQSAFDSIKAKNINIVVPFTDNVDYHIMAKDHADLSAIENGQERNVWVGVTANQTIDQAFSGWTKKLNDRNVAIAIQSIKFRSPNLAEKTLDPRFTACLFAGVQGSTPIAEPLTRKVPTSFVLETVENFEREKEASKAIRKGLVILADPNNTGLRIERSVTSYVKDNNPVYSEVSANESINSCVKFLRQALQAKIGNKITAGSKSDVENIAKANLAEQKNLGYILDFKDLSVSISGDTANVVFSVSAIEPLNFITVTANVVR